MRYLLALAGGAAISFGPGLVSAQAIGEPCTTEGARCTATTGTVSYCGRASDGTLTCGTDGAFCSGDSQCSSKYCSIYPVNGRNVYQCAQLFSAPDGRSCLRSTDCASHYCGSSANDRMTRVCIPQNYNELGAQCLAHTDCASGFCSYTDASVPNNGASKFCTIPGQRDLGETCNWASDCDSGFCDYTTGTSGGSNPYLACTDGTPQLADGVRCYTSTSCQSGFCGRVTANGIPICTYPGQLAEGDLCAQDAECSVGECEYGNVAGTDYARLICTTNGNMIPDGSLCPSANPEACASDVCDYTLAGDYQPRCVQPGSIAQGGICLSDAACATGFCSISDSSGNRKCIEPNSLPDDERCSEDLACESGHCGYVELNGAITVACTSESAQQDEGDRCQTSYDCASGYCGAYTNERGIYYSAGFCSDGSALGQQCAVDADCQSGRCARAHDYDPSTTCLEPLSAPSQRARQKRRIDLDALRTRFLCPRGLSMCLLDGFAGYECIDTTSSLEHCGGCNNAKDKALRGADCSELGEYGALSVACTDSRCVATTCDFGYELTKKGDCVVSSTRQRWTRGR